MSTALVGAAFMAFAGLIGGMMGSTTAGIWTAASLLVAAEYSLYVDARKRRRS